MSRPQVFVYMNEKTKRMVKVVADRLGVSEAELFRLLALPQIRQIARELKEGADPYLLRKRVLERRD